jgi:hypothetical protein
MHRLARGCRHSVFLIPNMLQFILHGKPPRSFARAGGTGTVAPVDGSHLTSATHGSPDPTVAGSFIDLASDDER